MGLGFPEAEKRGVPNTEDLMNFHQQSQQHYYFMDGTSPNSHSHSNSNFNPNSKDVLTSTPNRSSYYTATAAQERRKVEYARSLSLSQGTGRRLVPAASYLGVLVCLAASLLILPLILPPLPPPPAMLLLLLPVGILGMLMVLAFMPSNDTKDMASASSHTYM